MTPEEMYEAVLGYVRDTADPIEPDSVNTPEVLIKKSTLEAIVGEPLDHADVHARNDEFTELYKHLASAYGFTNFYDLYVFSEMNEMEALEKAGNKDFSRLHKVKRTVIRNGKPMQTTIYSDPDEQKDDVPEDSSVSRTSGGSQLRNARDMQGSSYVDASGKELASLSKEALGLKTRDNESLSPEAFSDVTGAFTLTDELGKNRALVGFGEDDSYVFISFIADDTEVEGLGMRAFFELIKYAKIRDKGLLMDDSTNPLAINLYLQYGLKRRRDGLWAVTRKNLERSVGDLPWLFV